MAVALLVYTVLSMALASLVVHRRTMSHSGDIPPNPFDLSLLAAGSVTVFIVFSHPVLFGLADFDFAALLPLSAGLAAEIALVILAVVAISWLARPIALPFAGLLPQSFLITSFMLHRLNVARDENAPLLPGWRFVGVAVALWVSFLLISDIALWLSARNSARPSLQETQNTLHASLALFAVLPAILIYGLGLGRGL